MPQTLATYRTRVAELLDDVTNARYTTGQIDAALRAALMDYSTIRPVKRTYQLDTTGYTVIALPADFAAMQITRVQLWDSNPNNMVDLVYYAWISDEQWQVQIKDTTYPAGKVLTITYTSPQTVDSLDSASGTTIDDDEIFVIGAAGYACQSRAISRAESINMQPAVQKQLKDQATYYLSVFFNRLPRSRGIITNAFDFPEPPAY